MKIRIASPDDRETLIALYLQLLESLQSHDFEILATRSNAEHFVDNLFLPAAERSEPVLIAWREPMLPDGNNAAGAIFWVLHPPMVETRNRAAHSHGAVGSAAVVETLMRVGVEILREIGATHVIEVLPAAEKMARKAAAAFGFTPLSTILRLEIAKVPPLE